jgi:hypothetical protein
MKNSKNIEEQQSEQLWQRQRTKKRVNQEWNEKESSQEEAEETSSCCCEISVHEEERSINRSVNRCTKVKQNELL